MASKTTLLSLTIYDSDGGLDFAIRGSQTRDYLSWRVGQGHTKEEIFSDLRSKFEQMIKATDYCFNDVFENEKNGGAV